jgi:Na+-transporting methylmalonyl-CoA/oxaloacetate decarboxylase gamma subunit
MLFQQGPAETTNFMILGFVFIFLSILIHVWSLYSRANRLKKDLEMLEELDK